jgi:hypothetical protein
LEFSFCEDWIPLAIGHVDQSFGVQALPDVSMTPEERAESARVEGLRFNAAERDHRGVVPALRADEDQLTIDESVVLQHQERPRDTAQDLEIFDLLRVRCQPPGSPIGQQVVQREQPSADRGLRASSPIAALIGLDQAIEPARRKVKQLDVSRSEVGLAVSVRE